MKPLVALLVVALAIGACGRKGEPVAPTPDSISDDLAKDRSMD